MFYLHCSLYFPPEYVIVKIPRNKVELDLNDLNQVLIYAHYVTLLQGSTNIRKNNAEILLWTSKEICLVVNTDKCECMNMT